MIWLRPPETGWRFTILWLTAWQDRYRFAAPIAADDWQMTAPG
jgi:hypothetical protein